MFNVPQFLTPVSQKTFFKGDKVQLKWNEEGTSLIVLAQTEVDKTGKSYYGETTLYVLSANGGFDSRISLDKEGPIHDVTWSPNSKEFGVVYGYMPAKTTIFNQRAVVTHSFPLAPRNTILFSPTSRFILVAGFGNLAGQMDIYDLEKDYRKVCTIEGGNPSVCEWSPDSKYILTATTSPRLRVDNGVRVWHVGGGLMYNESMVELYSVTFRPQRPDSFLPGDPLHLVPAPHASALAYLGTVKTPSKPAGAYRPPGARGTSTPLHFKREDEGGTAHVVSNGTSLVGVNGFGKPRRHVPGAEPVDDLPLGSALASGPSGSLDGDEILSKTALKNKKKREAKKAKEAEAKAGGYTPATDALVNGTDTWQQDYRDRKGHERGRSRGQEANSQIGHTRENSSQSPVNGGVSIGPTGKVTANSPNSLATPAAPTAEVADLSVASPGNSSPSAKKLRGLQKKIRAIEDLEMRLAHGEKLEDTQMKKIATKAAVQQELGSLEKE